MRRLAGLVTALVLAGGLAACGDKGKDEPGAAAGGETVAPPTAASEAAPSATPAAGAPPVAFFQCRSCHSVEPGRNGIGPTLYGIVGSKAGEVPGFNFSPALKESGIVWDRATLEQWLAGPTKMVPGTRMVIGVPDPVRRKDIIDYLETLK